MSGDKERSTPKEQGSLKVCGYLDGTTGHFCLHIQHHPRSDYRQSPSLASGVFEPPLTSRGEYQGSRFVQNCNPAIDFEAKIIDWDELLKKQGQCSCFKPTTGLMGLPDTDAVKMGLLKPKKGRKPQK